MGCAQMLDANVPLIQGVPRLARKTARSLQEPSQEVWRRRSCGYAKFHPEDSSSFEPNTTPGPNEIMLSDVSAIAPLLGPGGWGKGSCM